MVTRSPAMMQRLVEVAMAANAAPHGTKQAVYDQACREMGISLNTLMRALGEVAPRPQRKQRCDAGQVALSREEAVVISALLMDSMRKNNKRLLSIGQALSILRANGAVRAEAMDPATGELTPLSDSTVARALRHYRMHPDQLLAPAPSVNLKSLHPNHVWQIDASLCVLYYLSPRTQAESGLQVMPHDQFYKNKPRNLARIAADRVWSYEVTDHYSGSIFVDYVMGAESGQNICDSFIEAITQRSDDPFHGVPLNLMMDMGSVSALFMNLLRRLDVKPLPHAPRNARATGQVENARNIIECNFESALRLRPVADLAELRQQARRWAPYFNATAEHSRHGRTRTDVWLTIASDQLRIAPPVALCRELMTHAPVERKVNADLTVEFNGAFYRVAMVPRVMVGEKLLLSHSPYTADAAVVVDKAEDGSELLHVVPVVARDDAGFAADANVIGENYRRAPMTLADTHRTEVARSALGNGTQAELAARRKAITQGRAQPFQGRIDPYKPMEDAKLPTYLPRRGRQMEPATKVNLDPMPEPMLTHFQAALALSKRGLKLSPDANSRIAAWYPDGIPVNQLDDVCDRLQAWGRLASQMRSTSMQTERRVEVAVVSVFAACTELRRRLGSQYRLSIYAELSAQFPNGIPSDQLDALSARYLPGEDDAAPAQAVQGL